MGIGSVYWVVCIAVKVWYCVCLVLESCQSIIYIGYMKADSKTSLVSVTSSLQTFLFK